LLAVRGEGTACGFCSPLAGQVLFATGGGRFCSPLAGGRFVCHWRGAGFVCRWRSGAGFVRHEHGQLHFAGAATEQRTPGRVLCNPRPAPSSLFPRLSRRPDGPRGFGFLPHSALSTTSLSSRPGRHSALGAADGALNPRLLMLFSGFFMAWLGGLRNELRRYRMYGGLIIKSFIRTPGSGAIHRASQCPVNINMA